MYHLKFATPNITLSGLGWISRSSSYLFCIIIWTLLKTSLYIWLYCSSRAHGHYDDVATWSLFVNPTLNDIVAGVVVVMVWPAWPVHYYYSISNIINNLNDSPDQWSCTETVHMSPGVYIQFTVQVSNYYQWLWYCVLRLSYFFVCILVSSTWYFIQT